MKDELFEIVHHLDGFLRACAAIDKEYGDSIADVFIKDINESDIRKSIINIYQKFTDPQRPSSGKYEFKEVFEVGDGELQNSLEELLFPLPFNIDKSENTEIINRTRSNMVIKIIDLIRILRSESDSDINLYSEMKWIRPDSSYSGKVFIFPFDDKMLLLKVITISPRIPGT